jgi:hypothetical protein
MNLKWTQTELTLRPFLFPCFTSDIIGRIFREFFNDFVYNMLLFALNFIHTSPELSLLSN